MLGCAGIFGAMIYFEAYATRLSAFKLSPCCASNRVYSPSTPCQWRTTTGPTPSACVTCSSSTSSAACPSCLTFITGSFAKVGDYGVLLVSVVCVCVHRLTRPFLLLPPSVTQSPHFPLLQCRRHDTGRGLQGRDRYLARRGPTGGALERIAGWAPGFCALGLRAWALQHVRSRKGRGPYDRGQVQGAGAAVRAGGHPLSRPGARPGRGPQVQQEAETGCCFPGRLRLVLCTRLPVHYPCSITIFSAFLPGPGQGVHK